MIRFQAEPPDEHNHKPQVKTR